MFFDLKKAFDSVPHRALLDKLKSLQLNDHILKWVCDYLKDRKQRVVVNGEISETLPVISGVLQGSVIGPLLFLIYIDDVLRVSLSEGSHLTVYADDMLLYKPRKISLHCRTILTNLSFGLKLTCCSLTHPSVNIWLSRRNSTSTSNPQGPTSYSNRLTISSI